MPVLKEVFELLADRRGAIEAGAFGEMGWISTDRAATYQALKTDDEEQFMVRELPPRIAGRIAALHAKTTEAIFNEAAKARARAQVAAGAPSPAPAPSPSNKPPGAGGGGAPR